MSLPQFTDLQTGKPVFINPLLVQFVRQFDEEVSWITFDREHVVAIGMPADRIADKLWKAIQSAK